MTKKGLLERLAEGPVIGDGGFVFAMEKRGYVKAGPWTPEVVMEHPEAVEGLHREFLRAGADVMQAFTEDDARFCLALSTLEPPNTGLTLSKWLLYTSSGVFASMMSNSLPRFKKWLFR